MYIYYKHYCNNFRFELGGDLLRCKLIFNINFIYVQIRNIMEINSDKYYILSNTDVSIHTQHCDWIQTLHLGHVTTDILVKTFYDTWLKLAKCGRAETFVLCTFNSRKILLSERRVTTIRKKYYSYNVCHLSLPNVNWWYKY